MSTYLEIVEDSQEVAKLGQSSCAPRSSFPRELPLWLSELGINAHTALEMFIPSLPAFSPPFAPPFSHQAVSSLRARAGPWSLGHNQPLARTCFEAGAA